MTARSQTAGDDALKGQSTGHGDGDPTRVAGAVAKLPRVAKSPAVDGAGRRESAREVAARDDALERETRRTRDRREVLAHRIVAESTV